jgi:hypothetical protein
MVEHFSDGADILFRIDAVDSLQFTKRVYPREPITQIMGLTLSRLRS